MNPRLSFVLHPSGFFFFPLASGLLLLSTGVAAAEQETNIDHGRQMMLEAFEHEIEEISGDWMKGIETLEDWEEKRPEVRRRFAEMLGLHPEPGKTDLHVEVTGSVDHDAFTVHKLHYQSRPGLYVTANLYVPKELSAPVPAVLYLCGHASRVADGVSYGPKAAYQHHPAWYANNGMVSLVIDSIDNGEIRGLHHGTYSHERWWWYNRGYTPAAVEVWNAIRALDFLETLPEVDAERLGVSGRSGGGIYSWLLLAIDDRVQVATPTAGIADLRNHLINEVISGHCDCNYWNNSPRFDTQIMAALAAPRAVRLVNTDADPIFPVDSLHRIDAQMKKLYALYGKEERWDVFIGSGGHADTPELQNATFSWMHKWLMGNELSEIGPAESFFTNEQLRVLTEIPSDEQNTTIDEEFVQAAPIPPFPADREGWERLKRDWMAELARVTFAGWPGKHDVSGPNTVHQQTIDGYSLEAYEFSPQEAITLRLWTLQEEETSPERVVVRVVAEDGWLDWLAIVRAAAPDRMEELLGPGAHSVAWPKANPEALAALLEDLSETGSALVIVAPRGIGPTRFEEESSRGDTVRRSFQMLGQTRDGMRVWDVRQALAVIRTIPGFNTAPQVQSSGAMAGVALYASLFDEPVAELDLRALPASHREGPYLMNVSRILDIPAVVAMARERTSVILSDPDASDWEWPNRLAELLSSFHSTTPSLH